MRDVNEHELTDDELETARIETKRDYQKARETGRFIAHAATDYENVRDEAARRASMRDGSMTPDNSNHYPFNGWKARR
jgi:hypothetical protein